MTRKNRIRGVVLSLAATALWALTLVPPATADSSSSTKVQARSGSSRGSAQRGTSTRSTTSRSSSSRSVSPATGSSSRSGSKVTPPSRGSSPPSTSARAERRSDDTARSRDGRKIPSSDQVDRGTPRHRPHRFYPRYYRYGYTGWYNPYWYGSYYWGLPYYGGYYHYDYGYPGYHRRPYPHTRSAGPGALDLDVSPERAEIYIDGERVGIADDYDGFPGYLWLEGGVYDLVIYSPGYRTIARQITVRPGEVVDVEDRMSEGEAQRPEELFATTTERRDDRLARDRERAAGAAERAEAQPWEDDGAGTYVPEVERPSGDGYGDEGYGEYPMPDDVARLHFRVYPADAVIFLDGHFVGTAEELSRLSAGLVVEPGEHQLQVVHPDYRKETREIDAEEGDVLEIELELDRD